MSRPPQIFEQAAARAACLRRYASGAARGPLTGCFCQRPEYRLRGRHALSVRAAPEPTDVSPRARRGPRTPSAAWVVVTLLYSEVIAVKLV
jgi:hypothetical protein